VLIYGAMTGGVAVAKSIRAQMSARFELRGFISHDSHLKGMQMMGVRVYTLYEDLLNEMEGTKPTFHDKIMIAQVCEYDYDEVARDIDELVVEIAKKFDNRETFRQMKDTVPEY